MSNLASKASSSQTLQNFKSDVAPQNRQQGLTEQQIDEWEASSGG